MDATAQTLKAFIKKTSRMSLFICHYAVLCFNLESCSLLPVLKHSGIGHLYNSTVFSYYLVWLPSSDFIILKKVHGIPVTH